MTTTTAKTLYLTSFDGFIEFCRKSGNQAAQAQIDALERKANDLPVEWFDSLTGEIAKYKHSGRMDVDAGREIAKIIMAAGK